jgi:hypothetical protein
MSFATHIHVTRKARMKDNEMRHVIHDTRNSSGQCPRRDVTVRYGLQVHTEYTPEERHIHVNTNIYTPLLCFDGNFKTFCFTLRIKTQLDAFD